MAREQRFCQRCGALFVGIASAHFCEECKKLNKKEYSLKFYRENAKKIKKQKKKKYKYLYRLGRLPDKDLRSSDPFEGAEIKYCKSYNPQNLDCIKCFENQVKEYKQCNGN